MQHNWEAWRRYWGPDWSPGGLSPLVSKNLLPQSSDIQMVCYLCEGSGCLDKCVVPRGGSPYSHLNSLHLQVRSLGNDIWYLMSEHLKALHSRHFDLTGSFHALWQQGYTSHSWALSFRIPCRRYSYRLIAPLVIGIVWRGPELVTGISCSIPWPAVLPGWILSLLQPLGLQDVGLLAEELPVCWCSPEPAMALHWADALGLGVWEPAWKAMGHVSGKKSLILLQRMADSSIGTGHIQVDMSIF